MTIEEAFEQIKEEVIGRNLVIRSVEDVEQLHDRFIKLRRELSIIGKRIIDVMPHYRGEQMYSWDIHSGIFRPPLSIGEPRIGKDLERKAIVEFENVINKKVGRDVLRNFFNKERHGKDWDLLFQAQHAGIKTTLTDWSPDIISALFFATEKSYNSTTDNSDGQLWCFITPTRWIYGHNTYPTRDTFYDLDPFELKETILINPASYLDNIQDRIFEYRMFRQRGRFVMPSAETCHIPLNQHPNIQPFLFKARIPVDFKQIIRDELAERMVIRAKMYIDENPRRQDLITDINKTIFNL
jgi:hypothetical protein